MKRITINSKTGYLLACITGLVLTLSACSSDDATQAIAEAFVELKGKITSSENSAGENGVAVKGIYLDGNLLNAETVTANGGTFTLSVLNNIPVSLQASKTDFATLNSVGVESLLAKAYSVEQGPVAVTGELSIEIPRLEVAPATPDP